MDEQAGSRGTSKQGSCPFVFWVGHSSRQQLEDDSDVDEEEGRSRALECAPSAQMTTIHTNIPVQVREGATNSQQMEVVQGRRALVLETSFAALRRRDSVRDVRELIRESKR